MRRRFWLTLIVAVVVIVLAAAGAAVALLSDSTITAARFSTLRNDHTALRAFLQRMPKGADLHVHLSGAVFAEDLIGWAAQEGLCVRLSDATFVAPPCDAEKAPAVADATQRQNVYDAVVNAQSMRWFVPSAAVPSGHDQFFAAFGKFGEATWRVTAGMTVERLRHYQADAVQHTELMVSFFSGSQRARLVAAIKDQPDFAARLELIKANGLDAIVAEARDQVADLIGKIENALACGADRTQPGCAVSYRYIAQVNRNGAPDDVFVQTALAAALIRVEPRVVGLNFVGPEDYRVARRDYAAHMRMVGFLAGDVPVALHAGELWIGLVPPEDLLSHIRQAVETARARRIGHGVALAFERDMDGLLAEMRRRDVAVEVNLTSNDVILGVRGKDHPLPAYLKAGVPVVLSTDDAGVSRIDLTNEYFRAVRDYGLGYRELKAIARGALVHSFLVARDKQMEFERFDRASADFERSIASRGSMLGNIAAVLAAILAH
jgi:adenosine deaminase